jgi:pimeloyl-ACP methyl ester carboxylesterase
MSAPNPNPNPNSSPSLLAPTRFIETNGRRLAYRRFGAGTPIVLCVRFRGTMESWDPAFLDALAAGGLEVIVFDYSGLGLSTGEPSYNPAALARDALDLIGVLGLPRAAIGGWSVGGIATQILLAQAPQRVSHLVLIATTPPGPLAKTGEPLFFELAKRSNDDPEDIVQLFFEPRSASSRAAAARSMARPAARSGPDVPYEWAGRQLGDGPRNPMFPADAVLQALKTTTVPMLHIGADHDIVFPVENWYALNGQLPTLQLLTFPSAGHGPQLQYPQAAADHIAGFVQSLAD